MRIPPSQPHFGTIYQIPGNAPVDEDTLWNMHSNDVHFKLVAPNDLTYTTVFDPHTQDTFVITGNQDSSNFLNGSMPQELLNTPVTFPRALSTTPQKKHENAPIKKESETPPDKEALAAKLDALFAEGNAEARRRKIRQNTDSVFKDAYKKLQKQYTENYTNSTLPKEEAEKQFETYKINHPAGRGGRYSNVAQGTFINYTI